MREHVQVAAIDGAHHASRNLVDGDDAALHEALHVGGRLLEVDRVAGIAQRLGAVADRVRLMSVWTIIGQST
jgi:hypothetical protein